MCVSAVKLSTTTETQAFPQRVQPPPGQSVSPSLRCQSHHQRCHSDLRHSRAQREPLGLIVAGADIHGGGLWEPAPWFNPNPRPSRSPQASTLYFRMFFSPSLDRARRVREPRRTLPSESSSTLTKRLVRTNHSVSPSVELPSFATRSWFLAWRLIPVESGTSLSCLSSSTVHTSLALRLHSLSGSAVRKVKQELGKQ